MGKACRWPAFDEGKNPSPMVLGPNVGPGPAPDQARLAFFQSLYDRQHGR